jgi:hypothetical protein
MNRQNLWVIFLVFGILATACSFNKDTVTSPTTNTKIPYSPSPANGASNRENFQRLSWESSSASSYTVYLDKVNPPVIIAKSNSSEKYADVVAYGNGVTYYWKVDAKYSDGTKGEGPVWHFTTSQTASSTPGYILKTHSVTTKEPNLVKMLFQVTDYENKGIPDLTINDFDILEDGAAVSIYESNLSITKRQNNPYLMKTVLMLDNSPSITDDIDNPNNLVLLKDAAKGFVDNMSAQQEIALYKFSSSSELILDFTSDKNALKAAIDNIGKGLPSTDLYGATIEGVSRWTDFIEVNNIVQGSLVLFTDGNDTQGSRTLQEALNAIGNKKVYTVGLGAEIEPEILKQIGNQGAYLISEMSELNQIFFQIQEEIDAYANSFYWMEYLSPKRGNNDHTIYLTVKNNQIFSVAEGTFSSAGFYDPVPGIYLNSSFVNQQGDSSFILVAGGDPVEIKAVTYGGNNTSVYSWGSDPSLTVNVLNPPENSNVKISANSGTSGTKTLQVKDAANGFSKNIEFNIR